MLAALLPVMWGAAAHADDAETVRTKGGAEYRGEVIERVPGDHLTMRMPGLIKRIEWADLATSPAPQRESGDGVEVVRMRDGRLESDQRQVTPEPEPAFAAR